MRHETHPAGRSLDTWVAFHVYDWEIAGENMPPHHGIPKGETVAREIPKYSTDVVAALDLMNELTAMGFSVTLDSKEKGTTHLVVITARVPGEPQTQWVARAGTMPHAMTLAALEAVDAFSREHEYAEALRSVKLRLT